VRKPDGARRGFLEGSDIVAARDRSGPDEESASLRERLLDVPWDVPRPVWYGRLVLLAVVAIWATSVLLSRMTEPPTLLHLTVILFHEAGHVIFMPFGEALRIAGGTLGQLLMPVICAVALHRRGDNFGAAICLAWMGMSLMDASVYAYDAADPLLPLIGGGTGSDSFHDFVFLFERYGQLGHERGWAMAMKALGAIAVYAALAWAAVVLFLQSEHLEDR
jgi:hypothetical protein